MNRTVKWLITAAVCVLAATVPLTVYAYLQKDLERPNNFIIAEDKEKITEVFTSPEYMSMQDNFKKEVYVENNGNSDQFIRVYLDFSDSRVRDNATIVFKTDHEGKNWDDFLNDLSENTTGWVYIPESQDELLGGYFYYTEILKPKPENTETSDSPDWKTSPLIQEIKTNFGNDSNTDHITDFDIIVYSESVQTVEIDTNGTIYTDYKTA